ncbi:MAG: phosphonate ABC transporter, permease protein PhnE, partial [Devosiaceae bacterium]|nr:phosphonate ABC transporter, permease protein PhnE [Devosiaceae bacterium]
MSATLDQYVGKRWRKPHFITSPGWRWGLIIASVIYLVLAFASVEINWSRVYRGLSRGWEFIVGFANPDFVSRWSDISSGMAESVVMTVASTVVGIALSIPVALGAARNIAPLPVYLVCRAIIALSRALNE